ncbi:MAG TPA: MucB/RseB C-terminal domain-containing protein [Xanthomonadales bacterium]|nr:MucB/RseB C-terminal domain-containing protein [Xanthomonadales bacterium]
MKLRVFWVSTLLLAALLQPALAGDDPHAWLQRMATAMSQMSYQGTFIYITDQRMETMRITHVMDENGSRERLSSVSGPRREVLRDQSGVKWIAGDDAAVMADPVVNWPMFLDQSLRGMNAQDANYKLKLRDRKRIAERIAQRLDIVATDSYRYGYSLWLEAGSGLLLQWQLNDQDGEVLAKLVFTELRMGSEVDENELKYIPSNRTQVTSGLPVAAAKSINSSGRWQAQWLPPGFRMTANRTPGEGPENHFQHQVYSDGLASVSLYVEPLDQVSGAGLGLRELGTSHIFSREADKVLITVVGDVPALTVEKIALSVSQHQP